MFGGKKSQMDQIRTMKDGEVGDFTEKGVLGTGNPKQFSWELPPL